MSDSKASHPLRILIVEDDDDARESLRDILELKDHDVTAAGTASAVLDSSKDLSSIDVILLDRKLPDGLAEELLPRFRKSAPHSDVVVVTGYADLQGTISALREGAADYIIKPINPDALLASLRRIGQRRQIERELLAEREFADMILNTAEAIVLILDTSGNIVRFNRFLTELTGYTLGEMVNRNWFETFIPERDREKILGLFKQTATEIKTRGIVNPIVTKDGREREIRWSNTTLMDNRGIRTGVLAVGMDVTDLIQAQQSLLQSERLATIGQTMTGLAHESRNALQRLQNAVDLLEDELQDNPSALRDLAKIGRASNDLRDLLEEVRQYASPIQLDRKFTAPCMAWRRAWSDLEPLHETRTIHLDEDAVDDDVELNIDGRRMEQVFRNLFENAIDACHDPVHIHLSCKADSEFVTVTVQDNGPGIPGNDRVKAFDAFYTTKPKGTGLGLAIVHRIIEAHGGAIKIVPTERGTKFEICLPRSASNTR